MSDVLYTLLGRMIWGIFRGYLRHRFPNMRRKLMAAGIAAIVLAGVGGAASARRRRPD